MNKRQRKKWLKRHNLYVSNSELYNLDCTISEWIVPRLKKFKQITCTYPGVEPFDTFEKWQDGLDKMIRAFELAKYDPIDLDENLNYDPDMRYDLKNYKEKHDKWNTEVQEGLDLFSKWFMALWI